MGFSLLFSTYVVFPLIYLLDILQFVLVVDTAADAEFCHGDTIFSIAQLVMRTLLFSYLIFLRYDMFFVNQVALFFYLNCLRCVIIHSLECFLYLLRHNNRFVVMVDITPGSEMQVYSYLHFFVNLVNTYHILFSW